MLFVIIEMQVLVQEFAMGIKLSKREAGHKQYILLASWKVKNRFVFLTGRNIDNGGFNC